MQYKHDERIGGWGVVFILFHGRRLDSPTHDIVQLYQNTISGWRSKKVVEGVLSPSLGGFGGMLLQRYILYCKKKRKKKKTVECRHFGGYVSRRLSKWTPCSSFLPRNFQGNGFGPILRFKMLPCFLSCFCCQLPNHEWLTSAMFFFPNGRKHFIFYFFKHVWYYVWFHCLVVHVLRFFFFFLLLPPPHHRRFRVRLTEPSLWNYHGEFVGTVAGSWPASS